MILATQTVAAIDKAIEVDGGAAFRVLQRSAFAALTDAFSPKEESFRSHLGISTIGRPCARDLWYSWHWCKKPTFNGRMLRLFNRGHLEEARFIAMLQLIGAKVWTTDENGKQFRVTSGHYGGSMDAIALGLPEFPEEPMLAEFKTHNDKSFRTLTQEGVMKAKWEHYVQMCVYGHAQGLTKALYLAVNKNDDTLHGEIIHIDPTVADRYNTRASSIITSPEPPQRINSSPGWYQCKLCNHRQMCHEFEMPERNCRTCAHSSPSDNAQWLCERHKTYLLASCEACPEYLVNPTILNGIEIIEASAAENWMKYKKADGTVVDSREAT